MIRWGLILAAALIAFAAGAISLMPARVVLDPIARSAGLRFEQAHGPLWDARLYGVSLAGQRAESARLQVAFWPLLTGRVRAVVDVSGPGLSLSGTLSRGGGEVRITGLAGDIAAWRLPGAADLGLSGPDGVVFSLDEAVFDEEAGCVSAAGVLRSDMLVSAGARYQTELPALSGVFTCSGPRLAVEASGESPVVALDGRALMGASAAEWSVQARGDAREIAIVMIALGFEDQGGVWRASGRTGYAAGQGG